MSKLQRLIDSLDRDELERVSNLPLEGKQAIFMRERLDAYRTGKLTTEADTDAQLSISATHTYQMSSVLLQRSLEVLVPDSGLPLLQFLQRKQLPLIFRGELLRYERTELSGADLQRKADFYFGAMVLLTRFTGRRSEDDLVAHCRAEYAAAVKNDRLKLLQLEGLELAAGIPIRFRDAVNPSDSGTEIEKEVIAYSRRVAKSQDGVCLFFEGLARAQLVFWKSYDAAGFAEAIAVARTHVSALLHPIFHDMAKRLDLFTVDAMMIGGDLLGAFAGYDRLFASIKRSDDLWDEPYFVMRYAELALVQDRIELAEQILHEHCSFLPYVLPIPASTHTTVLHALICLFRDEQKRAGELIQHAYTLNSKQNRNFFADVRIRMVQCALFALQHDRNMVEVVCDRALQLLRSRQMGQRTFSAGRYFILLRAFARYADKRIAIAPELIESFESFTDGSFGVFGRLIVRVKEALSVPI